MRDDSNCRNIADGFVQAARKFPDRPALEVDGAVFAYSELFERASSIASTIAMLATSEASPLVAVFAYRSVSAFAGVLGALMAGRGYVPLNRHFPGDRTVSMLKRSRSRVIVTDAASEPQLPDLIEAYSDELVVLLPDRENVGDYARRFPQHKFLGSRQLQSARERDIATNVNGQSLAYLLFTSGSTGVPKGVMVTQSNVRHYIDCMTHRYEITEHDRCSQTFDMTFDLSVHDMLMTWERGACLCCPTRKALLNPGQFIESKRLSVWFSVPSMALLMVKLGALKADRFASLRLSLFCGEALTQETAIQWRQAAPHSVIENIYGPTELTIACTAYRWRDQLSLQHSHSGLVPIGEPLSGMDAIVVDDHLREVGVGDSGELMLTGPQMALGYLNDDERTVKAFVVPPGKQVRYYRTGDLVRRASENSPLVYLGRRDNQIKVSGYRVELGEVEAAVRTASGAQGVVALGWPTVGSSAAGIAVFIQADRLDIDALRKDLAKSLPSYMVPRSIRIVASMPLNSNGKFDRSALTTILESSHLD
jgi:amino acid adenylation domain-containing protein